MKTITTLLSAAAVLVAGVTVAGAQGGANSAAPLALRARPRAPVLELIPA